MNRPQFFRDNGGPSAAYLLAAAVCLLGMLVPSGALAAGLQSTAVDEPARMYPRSLGYDLPAMVLSAEEFPVDGLASAGGRLIGPEQEAENMAPVLGMEPDVLLEQLEETGWTARYLGDVGLPREDDPALYAVGGSSYVVEYDDEAGAAEGFALLEDEAGPESEDSRVREIGDEAELTQTESEDTSTGLRYVSLDYTFRTDNLVAGVALTWFEGAASSPVEPEAMEEAAERLMERMETVLDEGAPGLSGKLLRLDATGAVAVQQPFEAYDMLDGEVILRYGETEEMIEPYQEMWEESGVGAVYAAWANYLPANARDDSANATYFGSHIYGLSSRRDARSFVDTAVDDSLRNSSDSGYSDVQELQEVPDHDGSIRGVSYTFVLPDGSEVTGVRIWFQIDTYVVSLEADSPDGVAPDLLFELIDSQVDCIDEERFCRPVNAPEELVG